MIEGLPSAADFFPLKLLRLTVFKTYGIIHT